MMCHTTLTQGVSARHTIHVSCACVFDLSSTHSLHSSFVSPIFYFILLRSLALWSTTLLSQVMSPTSSTTTTTERPLKFSSRSHPPTRGPRTCMTRNPVTRPSAERSLHHCSFRSDKNQRAVDKLITLLKKVCCHLSPFSHTQVHRDPYTNLVRLKNGNQVATWKTKESGISLKDKKSKFSLKSELSECPMPQHGAS